MLTVGGGRYVEAARKNQRIALVGLIGAFLVSILAGCGENSDSAAPNQYQFWTGSVGATDGGLGLGPKQYPFLCWTVESGLGQPLIDNQNQRGNAVFPALASGVPYYAAAPVGYSENCGIMTRVDYFYWDTAANNFLKFDPATMFTTRPATLGTVTLAGFATPQPFVVRVETGTLNRFLYTIAMLAPFAEGASSPAALNNSAWNNKLVYYFRGGVGIGHWQGEAAWVPGLWSAERASFPLLLQQGYAIATSSGNETGVHYNLRLAEETMLMVKEHFIATYGNPAYTVGMGGSGGAIQQYAIGQNHPGLLDAGIPLYSFPDMVTQTIHVADCNSLEQYFLEDVMMKGAASKWSVWSRRQWIEGLNAVDGFTRPAQFNALPPPGGFSECNNGWFGAAPLVLNPLFTDPVYITALNKYRYSASVISGIKWTHWNDLENIYGVDQNGYAPIPFDNVGVQYGLEALLRGNITTAEFVEINACAGSWKEQKDFVMWNVGADPFDSANMNRNATNCRLPYGAGWAANPRRTGDLGAMNKAYTSGHVFTGAIDIPLIDLRPYLEPQLNMHNSRQSFSVRQRMLNKKGNAGNMVVWFTGSEADVPARIVDAMGVLDRYLMSGSKPAEFVDKCVGPAGNLIASGPNVWDGILNASAPGTCTLTYPIKSSSRMVAGDGVAGDMFKCALKPVAFGLADGTFGTIAFTANQVAQLNTMFPTGVCDYRQRDAGKPAGF
jgi:Tannase-like family of unknown function (DUF6351)